MLMYDVAFFLRETEIDNGSDVPKEKSVDKKYVCLYA